MIRISFKALMLVLLLATSGCKVPEKDFRRFQQNNMRTIALGAESFHLSHGRYPSNFGEMEGCCADGECPTIDVWGLAVRYSASEDNYTVHSAGPDGKFGTADDMILCKEDLDLGEDWERKKKERNQEELKKDNTEQKTGQPLDRSQNEAIPK
jgi:hypothetical protein